jgi:hypothetical protein
MTMGATLAADFGPSFSDWLAFYEDDRNPPDEALIDRVCICKLEDGSTLIRRLARSSREGFWTLQPAQKDGHPVDVRLTWAALVLEVRPPGPFPADDFIQDFREAGGRIGIHRDAVFEIYGGAAGQVVRQYLDRMRVDSDFDLEIRRALESEVATFPADYLAQLHAY